MSACKSFLHSVRINGHRSIRNCDLTFKPGLNIIIGSKESGKSHLLEVIAAGLEMDSDSLENMEVSLLIKDSGNQRDLLNITIAAPPKPPVKSSGYSFFPGPLRVAFLEQEVEDEDGSLHTLLFEGQAFVEAKRAYPNLFPVFWRSKMPEAIPLFDAEGAISIRGGSAQWIGKSAASSALNFPKQLISKLNNLEFPESAKSENLKSRILEAFNFLVNYDQVFVAFSPITSLRLNPHFSLQMGIDSSWETSGAHLEFQVADRWLSFDQLPDGTKRLVLLIGEIIFARQFNLYFERDIEEESPSGRILLMEEPETGIAPEQLPRLLGLIQEASKYEQIILTTHSPEVLDILDLGELDRIILSAFDSQNGSTFRHLSEKEMENALSVLKVGPLSSFGRESDLSMGID